MKSHLKIGTNWEIDLVKKILRLNKDIGEKNGIVVNEFYGSLPEDVYGTARSKDRLHKSDLRTLKEHIKICHDNNIKFAYASNALCWGSTNSIDEMINPFIEHVNTLCGAGIDSIIVAFPLLIEKIKANFPNLTVITSTIAHVDSIKMADYYRQIGSDVIVLPVDSNRNFSLLKSLKEKYENLEFELLMTDACVYECPWRQNHFATQSHDSKEVKREYKNSDVALYPLDRCWNKLKENWPKEFLKSRWIRPEDIELYEKIGFHLFKISGRTIPKENILRSVTAYLKREHTGNFLEILPIIPGDYEKEGQTIATMFINNKKLDGFLKYFINKKGDCRNECGILCNYCDDYASKMVKNNVNK